MRDAFAIAILPGDEITIENPFVDVEYPGIPKDAQLTIKSSDLSWVLRRFGHPYSWDPSWKANYSGTVYKNPAGIGPNEYKNDWWWVDLMHYRRTGPFAHSMLQNASRPLHKAYAKGYWTHIAADVCGHPYVNTVVGGPFRTHVIRHMVMENVMDTWLWDHYKNAELMGAGLDAYVDVGEDFTSIAEFLGEHLKKVYLEPPAPYLPLEPENFADKLPSADDWQRAYDTMLIFLSMSTNSQLDPPTPPPGSPSEFMEEIMDSVKKSAQKLKKSFNPSGWSWWQWLLAPFIIALNALTLITKLLTLPAQIIIRLATLAPRWYLYYLQLAFYEFIVNARWVMALSGWGKFSRLDLDRTFSKLCYHLPADRVGRPGSYLYPYTNVPRHSLFWLIDPRWMKLIDPQWAQSCQEGPILTEASPYPTYATPDIFIDGPAYYQPMDRTLKGFAGPPAIPIDTQNAINASVSAKLAEETYGHPQFGNSVEFAVRLINGTYPPACFDLDGDRGYGYLSWEGWPPKHTPQYIKNLFYA